MAPLLDELATDRRRRRPRRAGRGARGAAAHRRGWWHRPVRRHRLQGLDALPAAPVPVRARAARRVVLPRPAARRDPRRLPRTHRARCSRSSTAAPTTTPSTAARIVALETKIAAAHWDVVKRRDADLTYNLRNFADLPAEAPGFDWAGWVTALGSLAGARRRGRGAPARRPDRVRRAVGGARTSRTGSVGCAGKLISGRASLLTDDLVDENFAFYGRTLSGTEQMRDRWKRGVGLVENLMGDAVGQALRRAALPAGRQGADGRAGGESARGLPRQHHRPGVDDPGDARARAGEARQVHPEDRLSGALARLFGARRRPRRPVRQLPARQRGRATTASSPSWAARSTATSGS